MKKFIYILLVILVACKPDVTPEPEMVSQVSFVQISDVDNVLVVDQEITLMVNLITGETITSNVEGVWKSSNESIGEIIGANTLKIKDLGVFQIIVTYQGLSDSLTINAIDKENLAKVINIKTDKSEISINENANFSVVILGDNNKEITQENTTWIVTDTTIGTITNNGIFTAKKHGYTEVYVRSNGLVSEKLGVSIYRQGTFEGKENHSASGSVKLVLRNGQLLIETQDDFSVQSGPDLRVFLSNIEYGSRINSEALELLLLKSNSGKATYLIPSNVNINDYEYVNVHCKQYKTTFGSAKFD